MKLVPVLLNDDVKTIAEASACYAIEHNHKVTIAIVDSGGHLLHLNRLEDTAPFTVDMATAKAKTAALTKRETGFYEDLVLKGRLSFLGMPLEGIMEGGFPIIIEEQVVGAIGVSGSTSQIDAKIANVALNNYQHKAF